MAFWQSAHTLPRVSFPSSVVRSIIEMASLRPHTFESFLRERLAREAARSSNATASTPCTISSASAIERRKAAGGKEGGLGTRASLMRGVKVAQSKFELRFSNFGDRVSKVEESNFEFRRSNLDFRTSEIERRTPETQLRRSNF